MTSREREGREEGEGGIVGLEGSEGVRKGREAGEGGRVGLEGKEEGRGGR